MPDICVLLLPDAPAFTVHAISEGFTKATGLHIESLKNKSLFDAFPPNPDEPDFTGKRNLIASFEYVLVRKEQHRIPVQRYDIRNQDGDYRERYWSSLNTPVLDVEGAVRYIIHTVEDLTEQVIAKKKEESTRQNFEFLFNQSDVPFAILKGKDLVFSFVNPAYSKLLNERKLVGKSLLEAVPELEGQPFFPALQTVFNEGVPLQFPGIPATINFDDSGTPTTRYFNMTYVPYKNVSGASEGILAMGYDVTENLELRERKKKGELDYQAYNLFMQAPVPICIIKGENQVIELANGWMLKAWGKEADVIGKPLLEALPELQGTAFPDVLNKVRITGEAYHASESQVNLMRNGKEETAYVNFVYQPFYETDGSISGVLAIAHEITEQVNARKKVEENEKRFRNLVDEAPVATAVLTGENFVIELVNEAMCKSWGKDVSVVGKPIKEALPELEGQPFFGLLSHVYKTGETYRATEGKANLVVDGTLQTFYFNFTYKALRNADGVIHGILIMAVDVTAEVINRNRIEESEASFRLLANSMPQFVWTADKHGNMDYFNQAVYDFLGSDFEGLKDYGWLRVVHPDDREENISKWKTSIATGEEFIFRHRFKYKDGSYKWQLSRAVAQTDEEGKIQLWIGTSTNIHDQKMFEEELQRRVSERTFELERSNRNLEEFAHAASHDLKEPIRKVHYFADRLKHNLKDRLNEDEAGIFQRMENAAERMGILVDDLLEYSQASMKSPEMEEINLNEKLNNVIELLELQVEEKKAEIQIGPLPTIKGYKRQILQLFQNLIGNALKYHKPGIAPRIKITARIVDANNSEINFPYQDLKCLYHLLEVEDNGIGFEPAQAERIFQMFTRLHGNKEYKGTGIGLSIARKVVQNHKGFIWAESKPGEGANFKILLPV